MEPVLRIGEIEIRWLRGGDFQLDGGTMFGAVPKVLWSRNCEADQENCIPLCNDPLLIRTPESTMLVDTGLGNKFTAKQEKIFKVTRPWRLLDELSLLGLAAEDIDWVILSHCDFDHAGGIVSLDGDGKAALTFPRARHLIQAKEWHDVTNPNNRSIHTYWPDNFKALSDEALLLVDGDHQVATGVSVRYSGGHTMGHQVVVVESQGQCAVHLGDLFPTHFHTNPLWVMAYDNFPLEVVALKEQLFAEFGPRQAWFTFYHDMKVRACTMDEKGGIIKRIDRR